MSEHDEILRRRRARPHRTSPTSDGARALRPGSSSAAPPDAEAVRRGDANARDAPAPIGPIDVGFGLPRAVSPAAAIASLYRHWQHAGEVLERLSQCLSRRDARGGLRALARVASALLVADALVEIVAREQLDEPPIATQLRQELLGELVPWLAAVRHHLPEAAAQLASYPPPRRRCR
jgi:hypothetical protein